MATAAAMAALFGLGHVDANGTAVELGAVEGRHGLVSRIVILKGHEAKATRTAGVAITDHNGLTDFAVNAESVPQGVVIHSPAQTSNK